MTGFGTAAEVVGGVVARSGAEGEVSAAAGATSEEGGPVEIGNRLELTAEERERIRLAVQAAERRHERRNRSDDRGARGTLSRGPALGRSRTRALWRLTTLLTIESHWLPWGWHASNAAGLVLATLVAYGCGAWLGKLVAGDSSVHLQPNGCGIK